MYFIFYPYMIGVFLYMMIIVNTFTTSTSFFIFYSSFTRDKELHPILYADFNRNDQIDDFMVFQNIYYNIYTDYANRI